MHLFEPTPVTLVPPANLQTWKGDTFESVGGDVLIRCSELPPARCVTEGRGLFSAVCERESKEATFIDLTKACDAINSNLARIKLHAIDLTSLVCRLFHKWGAKCCNLTDELR